MCSAAAMMNVANAGQPGSRKIGPALTTVRRRRVDLVAAHLQPAPSAGILGWLSGLLGGAAEDSAVTEQAAVVGVVQACFYRASNEERAETGAALRGPFVRTRTDCLS